MADDNNIKFIETELKKNKYGMFIRKIAPEFSDKTLRHYIYEYGRELDDKLVVREPPIVIYNR